MACYRYLEEALDAPGPKAPNSGDPDEVSLLQSKIQAALSVTIVLMIHLIFMI